MEGMIWDCTQAGILPLNVDLPPTAVHYSLPLKQFFWRLLSLLEIGNMLKLNGVVVVVFLILIL